jgi:cytochrome c oxidase subunit 3
MSNIIKHPYHIVDESPWPIYASLAGMYLVTGFLFWFHLKDLNLLVIGLIRISLIIFQWWRDISREGIFQGLHRAIVELGLRSGIILFIVSEIFFFLRFFWAYFHVRLSPSIEVGGVWPYDGILPFNPLGVPLLNTVILVSSGVRVTWSHHALIDGNYLEVKSGLFITIILGFYFSALQALEYYEAPFRFADGAYGSTFFIATGFHGVHVIIGTLFLLVCLVRHLNNQFSKTHHFGFEAAAWYWHFVDVIWLFLYLVIYWWGRL